MRRILCTATVLASITGGSMLLLPGVAGADSPRCVIVQSGEGKPSIEQRSDPPLCLGSGDNGPRIVVDGRFPRG